MTCDSCSHPEHAHEVATEAKPLRPCMVCPCPDFVPFIGYFGPPAVTEQEFAA